MDDRRQRVRERKGKTERDDDDYNEDDGDNEVEGLSHVRLSIIYVPHIYIGSISNDFLHLLGRRDKK